MPEFDEMEQTVLGFLDKAYASSPEPPPYLSAAIDESAPTGIAPEQLDTLRRKLQARLTKGSTLGVLVSRRRQAMAIEVEELALRSRWAPDRVETLEADTLDLSSVEPEALARLLRALAIKRIGPVDAPLRLLAQEHLAVYESFEGPLYGRTRRDVSPVDRRRDLTNGIAPLDREATARAADRYLREVQAALEGSRPNRS
ncbi:MAG TPA: hypothetical protein VNF24_00550 [Candidatus Acidoferrales bacterium]|nr:hypothetical protein [Candidatus Acidoferrales bacterium]HVC23603.1 hypothetical protein [Candidatus Dormibacteraeota bacterium]